MTPIEGLVKGNECPTCGEELVFEGTFYRGQEVECSCGQTVEIHRIEAVYTLTLRPMGKRSKCHGCQEWKDDPQDFYDGLRCRECADREMRAEENR